MMVSVVFEKAEKFAIKTNSDAQSLHDVPAGLARHHIIISPGHPKTLRKLNQQFRLINYAPQKYWGCFERSRDHHR